MLCFLSGRGARGQHGYEVAARTLEGNGAVRIDQATRAMFQDFKELLSSLNAHNVRYLIVGGYAVSFHAQPRATKDLDILVSADDENSKAVFAALAQFGAPVGGLTSRERATVAATGVWVLVR